MKRDFIFGIAAAFALAGLAAGCSTRDTDAGASGTGSLQLKVSATRAEGSAAGTGYDPLTDQQIRIYNNDGKLLRQSAKGLREQQLVRPPVVSDRNKAVHRHRKADQPGHQQPAQIDAVGEPRIKRNRHDLEQTGGKYRQADLQRTETAHTPQIQRG